MNKSSLSLFSFLFIMSTSVLANEPQIVQVEATPVANGARTFNVSVLHNDEGWDHYADNYEVLDPNGVILSTRTLFHPHENEQPFTRSQPNVQIPDGLTEIQVRAHDKVHGYGPAVRIPLPAPSEKIFFKP